jgi:hypothetical protein
LELLQLLTYLFWRVADMIRGICQLCHSLARERDLREVGWLGKFTVSSIVA